MLGQGVCGPVGHSGENRVSGGVDRRGRDEGKSFSPKCCTAIKMIPDIHCLILNKLMMSLEIDPSELALAP